MDDPNGGLPPPPSEKAEAHEAHNGGWGDGDGRPSFWRQVKALFIKNW